MKTKAAQATFDLARPRLSICSTRAQLFRLIMEKIADRRLLARQDSSQPPCSCFRSLRVLLSQIPDFALFDKIIQMRDRSGFWKDRKQLWGPSWCIGTESSLAVSEFLSSWDMTYFLGLDHFGGKTTASFYTSFGQPTRSEVRRCVCVSISPTCFARKTASGTATAATAGSASREPWCQRPAWPAGIPVPSVLVVPSHLLSVSFFGHY